MSSQAVKFRAVTFQAALSFAMLAAAAAAQTPVQLTTGSGVGGRFPVVARDADVIAYVAFVAGHRELFVVATDGSPALQLTTGGDVRVGHGTFDPGQPISISDDGNRIAYWNAQGVHVLDRAATTDVVVSPANLLPMPMLSGDGALVVYQDTAAGQLEVFRVDSAAAQAPVQLTTTSGPGRRLPNVVGDVVLFQKLVGEHMEVFRHDLTTNTTSGPLTNGSGGGNRNARLLPDGSGFAFEAVVAGEQTAYVYSFATSQAAAILAGASGNRMPWGDQDQQTAFELTGTSPEVYLASATTAQVSTTTRGGNKLPSLDRHGQVVVWQQEAQSSMEVFAARRCWPLSITHYGSHGTLSIGALQSFDRTYRCDLRFGVTTPFAPGTLGAFAFGPQQSVPLSGAPGNFLWVNPVGASLVLADATGAVAITFALSPATYAATVPCQFAVFDPAANSLGIVTSEGFELHVH